MLLVEAPREVTKPGPGVQCRLGVTGFSSSGRSSSSCIMVQARWALTLVLLLVALPAQDAGAAPRQAQAVGGWAGQGQHPALTDPDEQQQLGIQLTHFLSKTPEREAVPQEEAPQEGRQAVPVPEENTRAFHTTSVSGPEYQDGRRQSSLETSKVLHEILREMRVILAGVKSLSLNSAVSRRSTSTGNGRADPADEDDDEDDDVDGGAKPYLVVGRADPNAVDADNFQKYCVEGIVAVLGSMLLGMVLCCVLHVWRKRRKRLAASKASSERPDSRTEASRIFAGV
ncbi:PREDICTED: uncharacterized protein LOC108447782 [Corvus brachyrhynchos]|uniref:uncharacterized protein LOC108447782 n=1 Tax=Corvus brachyrhynchos TaxID=85066 RepID=UPI000816414E|nr:PREDICTED: uncharacterized protein LOC108447782 [Corvus brachyrhynchos]